MWKLVLAAIIFIAVKWVSGEFVNQGYPYDTSYPWNYRPLVGNRPEDEGSLDVNSVDGLIRTTVCRRKLMQMTFFLGETLKNVDHCTTFNFCNNTLCVYYSQSVIAFGGRRYSSRGQYIAQNRSCYIIEDDRDSDNPLLENCTTISVSVSHEMEKNVRKWENQVSNTVNLADIINASSSQRVAVIPKFFKHNTDVLMKYHESACALKSKALNIHQSGPLPIGCYNVALYNSTSKIFFNVNANLLSNTWFPNLRSCKSERTNPNTVNTTVKHFPFNLPGYKFCKTTFIGEFYKSEKPINDLDYLCYKYVSEKLSTDKFLANVWRRFKKLYMLFSTAFKDMQEHNQQLPYIHYKLVDGSLLYIHSDSFNQSAIWAEAILKIWQGYCEMDFLYSAEEEGKGSDEETPERTGEATVSESSHSYPVDSILSASSTSIVSATEADTPTLAEIDVYPPKPAGFGGCRLLINEICTKNEQEISFVEHIRLCPKLKSSKRSNSLSGFLEIIIQTGDVMKQVFFADFKDKLYTTVKEGRRQNSYFVIGTENSNPNMELSEVSAIDAYQTGIPAANENTMCIILLHVHNYKAAEGKRAIQLLKMQKIGDSWIENEINDERMNVIKKYYQDVTIIGPACLSTDCGFCFELLVLPPQVEQINDIHIPVPDITTSGGVKPYQSLNRCAYNSHPLQQDSITTCRPSPGFKNYCSQRITGRNLLPFSFDGTSLQSSAQKIIVNVKTFFDGTGTDPIVMEGNSVEKTGQVVGLHHQTVYKVMENWKKNAIATPGIKRPNRRSPVMEQFDSFRIEHIKRIIKGFYERNTPPLLTPVFNQLMTEVREEENGRRERGETVVPFRCSEYTFRKVLIKIGFRFGRINDRDVILQRSDIVAKRFEYLKAIRENRRSPNPKPIVYTDETWIDPHSRTGKAWTLHKAVNYRERSVYSYQRNKCGRGPRIIVLHAGGESGFVDGAMLVYPVQKKKACADYHDNVNSETYMRWWKTFLDSLPQSPHIVVIDNAPYHSRSDTPKSNALKQVMYDWLADNLPEEEKAEFKTVKEYRKPELWNKIKSMRNSNKYYVVDQEAERRGHTVVRLPPYNCDLNPIEYVWKDIKHDVRKSNTEQTLKSVEDKTKQIMNAYSAASWKKHVDHVKRLEDLYWEQDNFYENFMENNQERIIINLGPDEDDDEDDDDDGDGEYANVIHSNVHDEEILFEEEDPEEGTDNADSGPTDAVRRRLNFDDRK